MKKMIIDKKGFSLVEVMLGMIVLAILATPLLSNFITSAKINAMAKQRQDANALGQSIMEEMGNMPLDDIYTEYTTSGAGMDAMMLDGAGNWVVDSASSLSTKDRYGFRQMDIQGEGGNYDAFIEIIADGYETVYTSDGASTLVERNDFDVPNLIEINQERNVVMSEPTWVEGQALNEIAAQYCLANSSEIHTPKLEEKIKKELTRNIIVTLSDPKAGDKKVSAKVEYQYKYSTFTFNQVVYNSFELEQSIANVYLFFAPLKEPRNKDTITINNLLPSAEPKIELYVISQSLTPGEQDVIEPINKIEINLTNNNHRIEKIYINTINEITGATLNVPLPSSDLVTKTDDKQRLFEIKVKIYKAGTSFSADELLVEFVSGKGE